MISILPHKIALSLPYKNSLFWATKAPQEGSQDNSKTTLNQLHVALFLLKIAQKTLTKGFRKAYKSTPIKLAKGFESHTRITLCCPTKITPFEHRDVLYL